MIDKKIGIIATSESVYFLNVINNMVNLGYPPSCVFIGSKVENILFKIKSFNRIYNLHGPWEVLKRIWDRKLKTNNRIDEVHLSSHFELNKKYKFNTIYYDALNSGRLFMDIKNENLDLLLLAGCGIISKIIINSVKTTLNSHPAILPGARGVDVVEWSLLKHLPLGNTVHLVTSKVDAGSILKIGKINFQKGETFEKFQHRYLTEQAKLLTETAVEFISGNINETPNDLSKSFLFRAMNFKQHREAKRVFNKLQEEIA